MTDFIDLYDGDLPEPCNTWAESLKANKVALTYAGKYVSIPAGLFLLSCIANYFINKKTGSLCS